MEMYCSQCGTEVSSDSKFCHKCGKEIQSSNFASSDEPRQHEFSILAQLGKSTQNDIPSNSSSSTFNSKRKVIRFVLVGVLIAFLFSQVLLLIVLPFDGVDIFEGGAKNAGVGFMMFWALSFWYFWRIRNRSGWQGAIVGVLTIVFIAGLGKAILIEVRTSPHYYIENLIPLKSVNKHFPNQYELIHGYLVRLSKTKNLSLEQAVPLPYIAMKPIFLSALATTSNDAVVKYIKAKLKFATELSVKSPTLCKISITGDVNPEDTVLMYKSVSNETKSEFDEALSEVFDNAGIYNEDLDSEHNASIINRLIVDTDLERFNILINNSDTKKSDDDFCKAGLTVLGIANNLPQEDKVPFFRWLSSRGFFNLP